MGRIGFWQLLLDDRMSWWEAQRINEAHDTAEVAQGIADAAQFKSFNNETRINNLAREVVFLRTAMTVLVKTLKDSNVLDERLLDARLEAAMEEATAAMPRQAAGPTSIGEVLAQGQQGAVATKLTCVRCRNQVAASSTLMTADGPMCERCPT
jgi:cytochrome c-type biogenesis protein CcmH/NrfF